MYLDIHYEYPNPRMKKNSKNTRMLWDSNLCLGSKEVVIFNQTSALDHSAMP